MCNKTNDINEKKIFKSWKNKGYFSRTKGFGKYKNRSYTVVIPPPNITGKLHMGHALNDSIQDSIIRKARMQGYKTRWILGTDHAGIATQTKVDKFLAEQGINRREIGRERFIEECQKWRSEYGTTIVNQIKVMGCSVDYDNEQFTMSDDFSKAVRKLFVDWYKKNYIYKGKRIVNWCPHCTTAIADDEAEYEDEHGHLWYMRYPLENSVDGIDYITIATTRPETMLGDSGIAVSPKDKRYKNLIGKNVILPLVNRKIPIFEDFYVDETFGTGCVKVTPAHDPNDFAMGNRHNLERINVFNENAYIVDGYGKYSGLSAMQAREEIVKDFEDLGLLEKIEDLDHSVMHCYRCHTTLEPWLSEQWFVDVDKLKEKAMAVVKNGDIKFFPQRWSQVYLDWLSNLKDWCISRQLWWGHQIPMYYCTKCEWEDASVEKVDKCPKCNSNVVQDEDVLDTWFSSQLWPFATQGWGNEDAKGELEQYYPTQVLSTARDIMGLWVARMVMASEYCIDHIPFEHVLIHPTVMGADGKPMSKSRGNGVDPLDLIEKYSADAMRFGLLSQVTGTQAIRFDYQKIENARNFANKIRNAARFVMLNLKDYEEKSIKISLNSDVDNWIFSTLAKLVKNVNDAYKVYDFSTICKLLYSFFWNTYCDWYIEFSKSRLNSDDYLKKLNCQNNLLFVLLVALKLLHPIMPFITEEIYQQLPVKETKHLMMAQWPEVEDFKVYINENSEKSISIVCDIVSSVRSIRSRYKISPKQSLNIVVKPFISELTVLLDKQKDLICTLSNVENICIDEHACKSNSSSVSVTNNAEVYVILKGLVDFDLEKKRLLKELSILNKDKDKYSKKLQNPGFLKNAKPEIIEKDKAKLLDINNSIIILKKQIEQLV